jgi:hypothetical protein
MKWSMLYFWHISLDHFWWLLRMTRLGAWLQLKCSWVHLGLVMSKLRNVFEVDVSIIYMNISTLIIFNYALENTS